MVEVEVGDDELCGGDGFEVIETFQSVFNSLFSLFFGGWFGFFWGLVWFKVRLSWCEFTGVGWGPKAECHVCSL